MRLFFVIFIILSLLISTTLAKASNNYSTVQQDLYNTKNLLIQENTVQNNEPDISSDKYDVVETYNTLLPENLIINIKYTDYIVPNDYIFITNTYANIRKSPTTQSQIIKSAYRHERIPVLSKVTGEMGKNNSNSWYEVLLSEDSAPKSGYMFSSLAEVRKVNIPRMFDAVNSLKNEVDQNTIGYISNYRNINGLAPLFQGIVEDAYGIKRYQSAPAYTEPNSSSDFRYIQDGTLVSIIDETEKYYRIRSLNFKWEYYVEKKYVSFNNSIENLTKVVVIDRKNQNEGVFEYVDNQWNLISTTYATTGASSSYKLPTDLGYYMAIEKSSSFLYLDDITKKIQGYAPYAIRFNGGAYIHGVPVNYTKVDGNLVDPGMIEYSSTIGTIPLSHKCVRNYTSHAKFLYDWIEIGKSAVIVIE